MVKRLDRRTVLRSTSAFGAAGIASLAGCIADPEDGGGSGGDDTFKIGALQPTSGDLAYYGEISLMGFYSGLAHRFGADPVQRVETGTYEMETEEGPTFEFVVQDTGFDPSTAQSVA